MDNGKYLDIRGVSEPDNNADNLSTQNTSQFHPQTHSKLKNKPPVQFDQPNRWVKIQAWKKNLQNKDPTFLTFPVSRNANIMLKCKQKI